ncbi:hypothetical protein ACWEIJ_20150 [Lentzea sp. NPDC004789]
MTNPGSMGQRAAQQAARSFSTASQQHASASHQHLVRGASDAARRGGHHPRRRSGPLGLIGRLIRFVVTLVVLVVAAGIALLVLHQAAVIH